MTHTSDGMTDPLGALIGDPYCVDPADAVGEQTT